MEQSFRLARRLIGGASRGHPLCARAVTRKKEKKASNGNLLRCEGSRFRARFGRTGLPRSSLRIIQPAHTQSILLGRATCREMQKWAQGVWHIKSKGAMPTDMATASA